jgi:hypothetical protein
MQTFVVRMFVAEDLDGFDGVVEEPLTGDRRKFHDTATLVDWLLAAIDRRSRRGVPHLGNAVPVIDDNENSDGARRS